MLPQIKRKTLRSKIYQQGTEVSKSQKHRDFLDGFMGTAEELIIVTDARGIVRYINKRGLRMLECEKQEILGKNWHLWLAPENWPAYGQEIFDKINYPYFIESTFPRNFHGN